MEVGKSIVITEWPQKAGSEAKAQKLQYTSRRHNLQVTGQSMLRKGLPS